MMTIHATLSVYEVDGRESKPDDEELLVRSHWNETGVDGKVVIRVGGKNYTVAAQQLLEAVNRCIGFRT